jgi:hypothetical protein
MAAGGRPGYFFLAVVARGVVALGAVVLTVLVFDALVAVLALVALA